MANVILSNLPTYTGNTDGVYVVMNDSGNTTTYKVIKENLIGASGTISGLTTTGDINVGGNLGVTGNTIVTGGIRKSARVLTTTTTLTIADASGFIEFTPGVGPYTITLPNPTLAANSGIGYRFWQNTTDNITLSTPAGAFYGPSGGGLSTIVLVQDTTQYWDVWSDGFNWAVFAIMIA